MKNIWPEKRSTSWKNNMALIYIVEDDENILEIEEIALRNANYQVSGFSSARDMYEKLSKIKPDLFLLDIMLPDEDGNQILRNLRKNPETARIPAIMVTAKSSEIDLIKAFDEGSDDYIKKPFSIMELTSRVKAVLRRTNKNEDEHIVINYKDLNLNDEKRKVSISGENIDLTYKEYELLRYLLVNKGIVLSREKIMDYVWGTDFMGESRTLDMHIKTLRKKLGEYGDIIRTIRNVGYIVE